MTKGTRAFELTPRYTKPSWALVVLILRRNNEEKFPWKSTLYDYVINKSRRWMTDWKPIPIPVFCVWLLISEQDTWQRTSSINTWQITSSVSFSVSGNTRIEELGVNSPSLVYWFSKWEGSVKIHLCLLLRNHPFL